MAYTDDSVKAKLSALNETQEGIVTVAQWVMFHRRHAERTAQLWLQKLRDSPAAKRLNLIYLANEVAQQSRARRKDDFLIAFSPVIADAVATAYKGASNDIQQKIRRVIEVWRQRNIFEPSIQDAVEARVDELDKSRSTGKKPLLGGSLFSSPSASGSTPSELQPLVPLQTALSKAAVASGTSGTTANVEYEKMFDPNVPSPTPPVHAARLSQLLKTLASAESSVSEVIRSRLALMDGLEKLLETNRTALAKEEASLLQLQDKKAQTETKKRDVEDAIMRGFSENASTADIDSSGATETVPRPVVEGLTPPPVEAITPVGSPKQEPQLTTDAQNSAQTFGGFSLGSDQPVDASIPGLSGFGQPVTTAFEEVPQDNMNGLHTKKRKVAHEEEDYAKFAGGDLDADVAELLNQESHAQS
ncbi:RNA polymerase II-binding domain-containing protein [Aspergillus unguis]